MQRIWLAVCLCLGAFGAAHAGETVAWPPHYKADNGVEIAPRVLAQYDHYRFSDDRAVDGRARFDDTSDWRRRS